jgi:hypothetical protein
MRIQLAYERSQISVEGGMGLGSPPACLLDSGDVEAGGARARDAQCIASSTPLPPHWPCGRRSRAEKGRLAGLYPGGGRGEAPQRYLSSVRLALPLMSLSAAARAWSVVVASENHGRTFGCGMADCGRRFALVVVGALRGGATVEESVASDGAVCAGAGAGVGASSKGVDARVGGGGASTAPLADDGRRAADPPHVLPPCSAPLPLLPPPAPPLPPSRRFSASEVRDVYILAGLEKRTISLSPPGSETPAARCHADATLRLSLC